MVSTAPGPVDELRARAAACRTCPGMSCRPVLTRANGRANARIMCVGEAPGRLGAGRTGVPFLGDAAGARFERLLAAAGLQRDEVFVTNAVLCLPLDTRGRNRTPARSELRACSHWLEETIAAVDPVLVVAMGGQALEALRMIEAHEFSLSDASAGSPRDWAGRKLALVYHPGARSQVHRPWDAQLQDWRDLGGWLRDQAPDQRMLPA